MSERTKKSVAESFEADNRMLPHLPFLLQDLWSMGCSLDQIMSAVGSLKFPSKIINVLDLGCGKGAVSVSVAFKYGFNVTGIDAMKEFLNEANLKATEYNVLNLCTFVNEDINNYIKDNREYDLVIFASLGGILGSINETVRKIRTQVKNNGFILIDDSYLKPGISLTRKGYEYCRSYNETINELTAYGDILVHELNTTKSNHQLNKEYTTLIRKRADELINMKPEIKGLITQYVANQIEECEIIEQYLEGALWVIKKID